MNAEGPSAAAQGGCVGFGEVCRGTEPEVSWQLSVGGACRV
jgi:hypothetical protein